MNRRFDAAVDFPAARNGDQQSCVGVVDRSKKRQLLPGSENHQRAPSL
jgi:hypothetical protein